MRYLKYLIISIVSILVFTASNCFAIDLKLIDGAEAYEDAVKSLRNIKIDMRIEKEDHKDWLKKLDEQNKERRDSVFYSPYRIKFYQNKIIKSKKKIEEFNVKYNEAKKEVKRLEPIVGEYNKQLEIERKREDFKYTAAHFSKIIGIPIAFLLFISFLSRLMRRRYKRLLRENKITQEEYGQIMSDDNKSRLFDDDKGINPATGLPLVGIGISDAGGNVRGSSSRDSFSDSSQDYRDRHRWD